MIEKSKLNRSYLWIAVTIGMLFVLWVQLPRILDPYAIEEDLRNLEFLHRQSDPALFPTADFNGLSIIDIQLGSTTIVIDTNSPGFSLLYQLASGIVSPILLSKLLAFPLMFVGVYYIYRIGEKLSNAGTALTLSLAYIVLILASTSEISILSGLHRAFAVPLTLGLIYYLLVKRYRWALLMLFLNGIFYLPTFPVALMTFAFCLVSIRKDGRWRLSIEWRPLIELLLVVLIFIITVSPTIIDQFGRAQEGVESPVAEEQHLLDNPEFQEGGRKPLFVVFPFIGRGGLTTEARDGMILMLLGLFALFILILRRRQAVKPPQEVMKLFYSSLLSFLLAWTAIILTSSFLLYLPSRHSRVGLFLILLIFVGLNIQDSLRTAVELVMRNRQKFVWILLPLAVILLGFALSLPGNQSEYAIDFRSPFFAGLLIGLVLVMVLLVVVLNLRLAAAGPAEDKPVARPGKLTWLVLGGILFILSFLYSRIMVPDIYSPPEDSFPLLDFAQTLPVDSLIAGSPCAVNNIPFYGKRPVLFSCERYLSKPEMILDNFRALYASERQQVTDFCQKYGVTHLVVDEENFEGDYLAEGAYFFEPFDSILRPELRGRSDFVLNKVPDEQRMFQEGSIFVVSCNTIAASIGAG